MSASVSTAPPFLPFAQSAPYAAAATALGARVDVAEGDWGRAQIIARAGRRLISQGPVFAPGLAAEECSHALRRLARVPAMLLATPDAPVSGLGLVPLVTPVSHVLWPLDPGYEARLRPNWAASARKGLNGPGRIRRGGEAALARLIAAEASQQEARGYRGLSPAFSAALPRSAVQVWEMVWNGECVAAIAVVRHGATATYHLGWSNASGRALSAHAALLLNAARSLADAGVRWLDLGTVATDRAPGLAAFKLGTGGNLRRLGPTLWVLPA
jgi:hypothetical protein